MYTLAVGGLAASIVGLCALFALKYIELRRGAVFMPRARLQADRWARVMKAIMRFFAARIEQLPQDFILFLRMLIHIGAIIFARGARAAEYGAHKVADRVSYKHRFERGESQSAFLKSVSDHKNSLDPAKTRIRSEEM